jgi:RND family efflux transporter MFP subunit
MTPQEIEVFLNSGDARKANGEFQLIAPRDGTVVQEDFIEGALIEPGHILLTIADETSLWIEARLTPQQLEGVRVGAFARVRTNTGSLTGEVTQLHHNIDETTRTIAVRVSVTNPDDQLHPGEFVDVLLQNDQQELALAVPDSAVMRNPDGDWQVFVEEHNDEFRAVEVEVLHSSGGYSRIGGLKPGTRVVTQGAFFLQSELAKSGFDIHNH